MSEKMNYLQEQKEVLEKWILRIEKRRIRLRKQLDEIYDKIRKE